MAPFSNYMARYESIMKITGTIDNLVFYQLNGVNVVRKKSGFNSSDYKKKPSYQKVRENSSEFGHCSKTGKMLRNVLQDYLKDNGDKYLYQKFAKLMTEIKDLDLSSERGKRTVDKGLENAEAIIKLQNFSFGKFDNVQKDIAKSESLFSITIEKIKKFDADELELVTLQPNFNHYTCEKHSQIVPLTKANFYEFDKFYKDSDTLLYFGVLKNGGEILKLGFI